MGVSKRLIKYASLFKRTIFIALVLLTLGVIADLSGPFVAKTMIDQHIVGIEGNWYETSDHGNHSVEFKGHWYKRSVYFTKGEQKGHPVRILQVGTHFYFVNQALPFDGVRTQEGNVLVVTDKSQQVKISDVPVSASQLFRFYKPEFGGMWTLALMYFGLLVVSSVLTYGQRLLLQVSANKIITTMRRNVFGQIHRLPIHYFDNIPAGKVVSRITNDTEAIKDLYVTVLANICAGVINMTGIFVALFILNVQLGLVCLLLAPILLLWIYFYRKYAVVINHRIRTGLSEINAMINEMIQGMPVIRSFNREKRTFEEFEALNQEQYEQRVKLLGINSATGHNLVNTIKNVFFIALISYFGYRSFHLAGAISFGTLYAFVDYLNRLFQPVVQIVNQLANLEQARVSAERVFELLDEAGYAVSASEMEQYRGDVVFDHVHFSYDGKEDVLKGISFTARQGQTVALVGHTGSGKSSIMNLLFRFYDARAGKITIDGTDITSLSRQQVRRHMGIVLQDPFLFTGTIASNVSLGDSSITKQKIEQALADVGADRMLLNLPNGYDEPVLEKGSTLSQGQRQLISFARALAFDPAILVLDEATSSVDTETEAVIQEALEVLKKGRTTFIIAHRLSTIRTADLILVLDRGTIVERGSHEELLAKKGRYFQMYQLQQGERMLDIG